MKKHGVSQLSLAVLALTFDDAAVVAAPAPHRPPHVSPSDFGRAFLASREALVRVQGRPDSPAPTRPSGTAATLAKRRELWATGFIVGARGEVVFGAPETPPRALLIRTADGIDHEGVLLGYAGELRIAVAQMADGDRRPIVPLRVARRPGLRDKAWVVVIKHDEQGRPQPFAGQVEGDPELSRGSDSGQSGPGRSAGARADAAPPRVAGGDAPGPFSFAAVFAPAAPGSPVLSPAGELVGVALLEGNRRTRAVTIETLIPFLKDVVLGRR